MKYKIFFFLFLFSHICHSEINNAPNIVGHAFNEANSNKKSIFNISIRKITKDDLLTYNLMDNNYVNLGIDFEFDVVKEILHQEYKLSLMNNEEKNDFLAAKQEKLRNFVELSKIKKFLAFNFNDNRFNYEESDQKDYNNRHLPHFINKDNFRNNIFNYIKSGSINNVRIIIDNNFDINSKNNRGQTLLIYAIICNKIDIVRLLIARGAKLEILDNDGLTAWDYAINSRNNSLIKLLENFEKNPAS